MDNNPGDINSIHQFLAQYRARHRPTLENLGTWGTDSFHSLTEPFPRPRPGSSGKAPSRHSVASSSTEYTRVTSVFSADAPVDPGPSRGNAQGLVLDDIPDRRELTDQELQALHVLATPPANLTATRMPCEFARYTGCEATFDAFGGVETWVSHELDVHLDWALPATCLCWFCDEFRFASEETHGGDRRLNFHSRMMHIAGHYQEGTAGPRIRADFFFLDHIWQCRLVSEEVFEREKRVHEEVQIEGLRPRGYVTARMAREEERRESVVVGTGSEDRRRRKEKRAGRVRRGNGESSGGPS